MMDRNVTGGGMEEDWAEDAPQLLAHWQLGPGPSMAQPPETQLLMRAAQLLEERGWTASASCDTAAPPAVGPLTAGQALVAADELVRGPGWRGPGWRTRAVRACSEIIDLALPDGDARVPLEVWCTAPRRTQAEVVGVLRRAGYRIEQTYLRERYGPPADDEEDDDAHTPLDRE